MTFSFSAPPRRAIPTSATRRSSPCAERKSSTRIALARSTSGEAESAFAAFSRPSGDPVRAISTSRAVTTGERCSTSAWVIVPARRRAVSSGLSPGSIDSTRIGAHSAPSATRRSFCSTSPALRCVWASSSSVRRICSTLPRSSPTRSSRIFFIRARSSCSVSREFSWRLGLGRSPDAPGLRTVPADEGSSRRKRRAAPRRLRARRTGERSIGVRGDLQP